MKLNTFELDKKIKTLVARERELLHEILQTLKEIDARKVYLELGFSSLFTYLTEGIGYSVGSAQRRIEALRLLKELPELGVKIQSGELNLNQISLVQKASREVYKTSAQKVSTADKRILLETIAEQNHQDSQKTVAAFFDLPVLQTTKQTVQADESVRLQLTLSKELHAKIQHAQSLLSHSLLDQDLLTYLEYVTDRVIQQKTSVRKAKVPSETPSESKAGNSHQKVDKFDHVDQPTSPAAQGARTKQSAQMQCDNISAVEVVISKTMPVLEVDSLIEIEPTVATKSQVFSSRTKKIILKNQPCCQYVDPVSGRKCQSRWLLQIDHRHSRWAGGDNCLENAQTLCAAHNQMKYRKETGWRTNL